MISGLTTFVLVVQAFLKIPALHALAPNGNEPPFAITQGVVLVLFAWPLCSPCDGFIPPQSSL